MINILYFLMWLSGPTQIAGLPGVTTSAFVSLWHGGSAVHSQAAQAHTK